MSTGERSASIDELLDRAVRAINNGDRAAATSLAEQVLAVEHGNPEAEDLFAASDNHGEIRRLALLFVDLVDSTGLSTASSRRPIAPWWAATARKWRSWSITMRATSIRSRATGC